MQKVTTDLGLILFCRIMSSQFGTAMSPLSLASLYIKYIKKNAYCFDTVFCSGGMHLDRTFILTDPFFCRGERFDSRTPAPRQMVLAFTSRGRYPVRTSGVDHTAIKYVMKIHDIFLYLFLRLEGYLKANPSRVLTWTSYDRIQTSIETHLGMNMNMNTITIFHLDAILRLISLFPIVRIEVHQS